MQDFFKYFILPRSKNLVSATVLIYDFTNIYIIQQKPYYSVANNRKFRTSLKKKCFTLNKIKQAMGLLRYFRSEMIWKSHLLRNSIFCARQKTFLKQNKEQNIEFQVTPPLTSNSKDFWRIKKSVSHYLKCNTIVYGLYEMFCSSQNPC